MLQVATLPCNLSLRTCFLTLMFYKVVWQHIARCDGIFNNRFTANVLENQPVKKNKNPLTFDSESTMSVVSPFLLNTVFMSQLAKAGMSSNLIIAKSGNRQYNIESNAVWIVTRANQCQR